MIPKTIHYCWFGGGQKPKLAKKCIASWQKYMPDYQIIEWNEDNFDVNYNPYTRMCYEQKKYAFLTDYLRLVIIIKYGGIYFDTDVEVIKRFDDLLNNQAFFGFETEKYINTGHGFGAEPGNNVVSQMLIEYDKLLDGQHGTIGCPVLNTRALAKLGVKENGQFQILNGAVIYPVDYFNPYDDPTGVLKKTKNTYSIHWYAKSWLSKRKVLRSILTKPIHRLLGKDFFRK